MTLEAWVFPTATPTSWRAIVDKTVDGYYLMASTDQGNRPSVGGTWVGGNQNTFGPSVLAVNAWTHLAATFDGATVRLFVNGAQVASQAQTTPLATTTGTLQIGGDSYPNEFFAGRIDEVRIYNGALSAAEIQTDMTSPIGNARSLPAVSLSSTDISFPDRVTGTTSSARTVTVTNTGGSTLLISSIAISGPHSLDYGHVNDCGSSLAPSGSCTISIVFAPRATGTRTATVVIPDSAPGSPHTIALAGTGVPPAGLSVSPRVVALTFTRTQQFTINGGSVTWLIDGVPGGSGALGTITPTGLYTPPSTTGAHTVTATASGQSANATVYVTDNPGVLTHHNDNFRTGQNVNETVLAPANVTPGTFGKLFACAVDGEVYAQPLYVANFLIQGGTHNVVFVATMNDSVYAFDADASPCVQYWQKSFLGTGVTTVPPADTGETRDINTQIGITGTPVIDPATGTLYVVARTRETVGTGCSDDSPCYFQRLHALDLATGGEKFSGPADISSAITVPGSGDTGDSTCPGSAGNVPFCPLRENQRPGLLLLNGKVYVAWASHGDITPYHGWVIGYAAADLAQAPVVFNTTPDGGLGGIWMSGTGPAADAAGNIYVITGNGTFDTAAPRTNYGDSFIRLSPAGGLSVADFFTPFNESSLDAQDFDVGSGGAIVLPDSAGSVAHPHLLIGGDKQGILYVIDRDNMTGFNAGGDQILQEVTVIGGSCITCGIFSTPAFWEGKLYVVAIGDVLKQYTLANASLTPALQAGDVFGFPGATPAISSNGATNGIVWVLDTSNNGTPNGSGSSRPAILFAYDATNLDKLYSSPTSGAGAAGNAVKFTVPTVANGKVYVGTQTELSVFGLFSGSDTTPPDTSITAAPPARSTCSSASFSYTATEAGSTFACQLDASAFAVCVSPQSYSGLADGSHSFQVRATDPAGNTDPTPASYTSTVDTTPPDTSITAAPPARSNSSSASFSFTATEAGSTFACQLDASAFAPCVSPQSYSGLADGSNSFQVRATDPAGNTDPTPASYTWTVDTTPPDTTITAAPPARSNSSSASFSFTATEAGSSFTCQLDASAFAPCASPKSYSGLALGTHTFQVRATDPAGNTDPTPASYPWTVVPVVPILGL